MITQKQYAKALLICKSYLAQISAEVHEVSTVNEVSNLFRGDMYEDRRMAEFVQTSNIAKEHFKDTTTLLYAYNFLMANNCRGVAVRMLLLLHNHLNNPKANGYGIDSTTPEPTFADLARPKRLIRQCRLIGYKSYAVLEALCRTVGVTLVPFELEYKTQP